MKNEHKCLRTSRKFTDVLSLESEFTSYEEIMQSLEAAVSSLVSCATECTSFKSEFKQLCCVETWEVNKDTTLYDLEQSRYGHDISNPSCK